MRRYSKDKISGRCPTHAAAYLRSAAIQIRVFLFQNSNAVVVAAGEDGGGGGGVFVQ